MINEDAIRFCNGEGLAAFVLYLEARGIYSDSEMYFYAIDCYFAERERERDSVKLSGYSVTIITLLFSRLTVRMFLC